MAALEVERHLALEPPPSQDRAAARPPDLPPGLIGDGDDGEDQDQAHDTQAPEGPVDGAGWRLRLAVASAAREGDSEQVTALIHHATSLGLAEGTLVAVARANWPPRAWPLRAATAGPRWLAGQTRRLHRPARRRGGGRVAEREGQP